MLQIIMFIMEIVKEITSSLYLFFTFFVRRRAVNPPVLARDDWKIVRALSEVIYMHVYIIFLRNLFFNAI